MVERPDGIKIAGCFIAAVLVVSFASRLSRSTELRFSGFEFADMTSKFLWDSLKHLEFPVLVPHRPGRSSLENKEETIRAMHRLPPEVPIVFVEAELGDPSEFRQVAAAGSDRKRRQVHRAGQTLCVDHACRGRDGPRAIGRRQTAGDSLRLERREPAGCEVLASCCSAKAMYRGWCVR